MQEVLSSLFCSALFCFSCHQELKDTLISTDRYRSLIAHWSAVLLTDSSEEV